MTGLVRHWLIGVVLMGAGCGSPTAGSSAPIDGTFALVRVDGVPLPVDQGPIPPAPHTGTFDPTCRFQLRDGTLEVHASSGSFALRYNTYNSCGNYRISWTDFVGRVTQVDGRLRFDAGAPHTFSFTGHLEGGVIRLSYSGKVLEFRGVPSVP